MLIYDVQHLKIKRNKTRLIFVKVFCVNAVRKTRCRFNALRFYRDKKNIHRKPESVDLITRRVSLLNSFRSRSSRLVNQVFK